RAAPARSRCGSAPSAGAAHALLVPPPRYAPAPALGRRPSPSSSLSSDFLTARAGDPDLLGALFEPVTRAGGLLGVRVDQRHVAHVDRRFLGDDAAFLGTPGALEVDLLVLADDVHAVDEHPLLLGVDEDDLAFTTAVAAGEHHDVIALLDLHRRRL